MFIRRITNMEMRDRGKDIAIVLSEYINQHWDIKLS